MPIVQVKTKFDIKKSLFLQYVCILLVVFSEFFIASYPQSEVIMSVKKLIVDFACITLLLCLLNQCQIKLNKNTVIFIWFMVAFIVYLIIGGLLNFESALTMVLGLRKIIRFYVLFFSCCFFLEYENTNSIFALFDCLFWINAIITVIQFVIRDLRQDYLGGIFGEEIGVNGATTIFLSVVVCVSILRCLNGQEKPLLCLFKSGVTLIIGALAELKFLFVVFTLVLTMAMVISRPSLRKYVIFASACSLVFLGNWLFAEIFGEPLSLIRIKELVLAKHYSSGSDLGRLTAIPTLAQTILVDIPSQLFGLGIGNCDVYSFDVNSSFVQMYGNLHYQWFASAILFLETGIIGLCFHFLFFVLCFFNAYRNMKKSAYDPVLCQISMIMSVVCSIITFYNSSIRSEIGFLLYFSLALHMIPVSKEAEFYKLGVDGRIIQMNEINEVDNPIENEGDNIDDDGHHHHTSHHSSHSNHHSHHHSHGRGYKKHYSHKRHSSRHNRSSNTSKKFLKWLKKYRSVLINVVSCSVSIVLLVLLAFHYENKPESPAVNSSIVDITQTSIKIESTLFFDEVSLTHQAINTFIADDTGKTANSVYRDYQGYSQDLDGEIPLEYTYRVAGLPSGIYLERATFDLSDNPDFGGYKTYLFEDGKDSILIYHLLPGTQYHYRLNLFLSSGNVVSTIDSFKTADSPRILSIDGIYNVRDIGGWKTADGRNIKYSLLYRGTEIDGGVEPTYCLTKEGVADMISELGIRYDMDLRSEYDNNGNVLGNGVIHKNFPVSMYSYIFDENNNQIVRNIFAELANKDNYPIYMHCTYGRDRTGTVCYLLEALLGMSDSDLRKEYELSAFKDSYADLESYAVFVSRINMLEGNTTQEKVEGYLLSIGVTDEQITNIREIFLGE